MSNQLQNKSKKSNNQTKKAKKSTTTQPIRDKEQLRKLINYYRAKGNIRNHVLIILGVHTALRISDLLRITYGDVYDFETEQFKPTLTVTEQKTGKPKIICLHENVVKALRLLIKQVKPCCRGQFIIENKRTGKAISRMQAYRIIRAAAEAIKLPQRVSCHSLRKTFGYISWKSGVSPVVIMDIFNHASIRVTMRYLGISQDDRDRVYLGLVV